MNDAHCNDRVVTVDIIKTDVDADISTFADGENKVDCAYFEDVEGKRDGACNAAWRMARSPLTSQKVR